jgi:hypothetical protein
VFVNPSHCAFIMQAARVISERDVISVHCASAVKRMQWFTKQFSRIHLPAVSDDDLCSGAAAGGPHSLHSLHNIHALRHIAKHNVLAVQPWRLQVMNKQNPDNPDCQRLKDSTYGNRAQEELRTVRAWARVGHGQDTRASVLQWGSKTTRAFKQSHRQSEPLGVTTHAPSDGSSHPRTSHRRWTRRQYHCHAVSRTRTNAPTHKLKLVGSHT